MGVYAEKKDGQLTGRFRVELQRVGERYRKRWATHAAALKDEDRVLKAWEAGESVASEKVVTPPPAPDTLAVVIPLADGMLWRSEEHTSELQSVMRISYAVFCLKKKKKQ